MQTTIFHCSTKWLLQIFIFMIIFTIGKTSFAADQSEGPEEPTLGFTLDITAGPDIASSSVRASGSVMHSTTDTEGETFGIAGEALNNAIAKNMGQKPNETFFSGELHDRYKWDPLKTVLVVQSATIEDLTLKDASFENIELDNSKGTVVAPLMAKTDQKVEHSVSSSWSQANEFSFDHKMEAKVEFLGVGGGAENSITYSHTWGTDATTGENMSIGSEAGTEVLVQPGKKTVVKISASRAELKVKIVYKAYLKGQVAVHYDPPYAHGGEPHYYYGPGINDILKSAELPNSKEVTAYFTVGYFTNVKITPIG